MTGFTLVLLALLGCIALLVMLLTGLVPTHFHGPAAVRAYCIISGWVGGLMTAVLLSADGRK